jgi:hypothetical protein
MTVAMPVAETPPIRANDRIGAARGIFDAWVAGAEATLKASFEVHNAGLAAGLAMLDATSTSQRAALQEWNKAAQRAQEAALQAFKAQVRATERATTPQAKN